MAAGICSTIDEEECIVFVDILKDAVILLPVCHENGTIEWPNCTYQAIVYIGGGTIFKGGGADSLKSKMARQRRPSRLCDAGGCLRGNVPPQKLELF